MAFRYSETFKADAIARVRAGKESLAALAEKLGVTTNTLARWRDAAPEPTKVPKATPPLESPVVPIVAPAPGGGLEEWLDARIEAAVQRALSRLKVSIQ